MGIFDGAGKERQGIHEQHYIFLVVPSVEILAQSWPHTLKWLIYRAFRDILRNSFSYISAIQRDRSGRSFY